MNSVSAKKVLCKKLTILAVITDYKDCNEKALLGLDTMFEVQLV